MSHKYLHSEYDDVIREVSFDVVNSISPDEGEMFDEIYGKITSQPTSKSSDKMIAFGIDSLTFLSSPAVIGMVSTVMGFIFSEVVKSVKDESSEWIKEKIKKLFKKNDKDKKSELPALTKEQFDTLKKLAVESAKRHGASEEDAEKMAMTLIASMNLPSS